MTRAPLSAPCCGSVLTTTAAGPPDLRSCDPALLWLLLPCPDTAADTLPLMIAVGDSSVGARSVAPGLRWQSQQVGKVGRASVQRR